MKLITAAMSALFICALCALPAVSAAPAKTESKPPAGAKNAPQAAATSQAGQKTGDAPKEKTSEKKSDAKAEAKKPAETPEEKKKRLEEFERKADLKKAEWIEKTIEYGIQKDRKEAITFIPTVKDPEKKKELQKKLVQILDADSDISILVKSLNIIAEMGYAEAAPSIRKLLSNDSEDVRVAATYAIKDIKAVDLKNELIDKLKAQDFTKDSNFTEAMLQTLADFKAVEIQEFVVEKIKDNKTSKNLRLSSILFLGRSGAAAAKDFLLKTFSDPDEEMDLRAYSVNALSKLEAKDALPAVNKVIDEINAYPYAKKKEYNSLYVYCISALVRLGDANAYPRLIESLKSDNPTTRVRAIKLLKDLGDKRSIDILKYKTQYDPSAAVQKEAKEALKALGEKVDEEPADDKAKKVPSGPKTPKKEKTDDTADDAKQNKREDF